MGFIKCGTIAGLITVGLAFVTYKLILEPHPVPIVEDEYWGPKSEEGKKEDTSIRPFKIDIQAPVLDDLKARLKRELDSFNRLVPPLEGIGFEYGFNSKYLKTVGDYWLNKYDWKAREKLLNKYPHFKTKIGGLDIHFQHVKPKAKNGAAPRTILVLHGWPGGVVEYHKMIPLLSEPKNSKYNYELVIPSLPGYGFSSAAARPGMSHTEMANIFKRLMKRLGHVRFFVMGGDWGGGITAEMATVYPEIVIAAQSTLCVSNTLASLLKYNLATMFPSLLMTPDIAKAVVPFTKLATVLLRESGYFHIQATKPDTVGVALTHSPIGLAAYMLEKFSTATNRNWINREDGGIPESVFTMDELLDNIMIFWVTGSFTPSMRLYKEAFDPAKKHKLDRVPTDVPFSCQYTPYEIVVYPEFVLSDKFRNLKVSLAQRGGHFAAFEVPELVADDAISHFEKF